MVHPHQASSRTTSPKSTTRKTAITQTTATSGQDALAKGGPALVALDDDPTGVQAMEDVSVALAWDAEAVAIGGETGSRALHIVTNSRALDSDGARRVTTEAAAAVSSAWPSTPVILRGDSTLRAHLLPEYDALRRTNIAIRLLLLFSCQLSRQPAE